MITSGDLLQRKCQPQQTGMAEDEIAEHFQAVEDWTLDSGHIVKTFQFKNFHHTMAFVNAMAEIIHVEDHHPELVITYNRCTVKFSTHSVNQGKGGLSINDFICAAKINTLFAQYFAST
jgi:4a-hydroxytetrahydrobiopterin dehydratase